MTNAPAGLPTGGGASQAADLNTVISVYPALASGTGTAQAPVIGWDSTAALSGSGSLSPAPSVTAGPHPVLSGSGTLSGAETTAASPGTLTGVYRGPCGVWAQDGVTSGGAQSGITAYALWLGRQVSYVLDYVMDAPASWLQFTGATLNNGVAGFTTLNSWGTLPAWQTMLLSLPACVGASAGSGGATWTAEAAGTNDTYWTTLGNNLVSWGYGNAVLRIGREFNGNAYNWCPASTGDTEAQYISGYQHIVTLLRGIAGSSFTFMWNPGMNPGTMNGQVGSPAETQNWYPGNAYVDCIGLDAYDEGNYTGQTSAPYGSRTITQKDSNWSYLQTQQDGFNSWVSFAFSNSQQLALPEWGLVTWLAGGTYYGGGDDTNYIQQMYTLTPSFFMQAAWENLGYGLFDTDADASRVSGMQAPDASRILFLHLFGTQYAVLSGTGTLTPKPTGTWKSGASLAGIGTIYTLATGGLVFGTSISTPYSYPLSSCVFVAPPGSAEWVPLGSIGVMTALTYSFTCPGGADQMTATLMVPATYRTQLFDPGWQVKITRGGHQVWDGKLDEGVPSSSGWALTASGTGNRGTDYLAMFTSTWPASEPDQAINNAIARGMPWTNTGVGTPSGAWYGQAIDSGAQTITDLLNLICTRGALTWMVNSQPGGVPGDDLNVFPLPTTVTRLLTCNTPVPRTLGGDINTIYLRYAISADVTNSAGTDVPAVYGLTSVTNAQSVAAHQALETFIDLSDVGVMTQAAAQAVGTSVLAIYQRASFAGPFTASYGQLMNTGGVPIDPGTDQAGTVMKLILSDFGYGGEVTPQFPITFITGAYEWDDLTQTATITPYQSVDQSLQGLLSLEGTILTPIATAGG